MASQIGTTLSNLVSALKALGIFSSVATVEPKGAPGKGLTAAIFFASAAPAAGASSLKRASGLYVFTVRVYTDMLAEPTASIDPELVAAVDKVIDALAGDFDLGATVRNVDFFGAQGTPLRAEAGYIEAGGKMFRIVDVTLPLVVNDAFSEFVQ